MSRTDTRGHKVYAQYDIYVTHAATLFNVDVREVTEQQRETAKRDLFGALYSNSESLRVKALLAKRMAEPDEPYTIT